MRQSRRHMSFTLIRMMVLAFAVTASGSDPSEYSCSQGNRLVAHGHFVEAVAAYTRSLQLTPTEARVYYYRALANEMVDRQAAIADWRQFAEMAASDSRLKEARAQAQQRARALEKMPALPDQLHRSKYVSKAGDYYQKVAEVSAGRLWTDFQTEFPIKLFADNMPEEWRRAVREALSAWMSVFPLQTVTTREKVDIVLGWAPLTQPIVGTERDAIQVRKEGNRVVSRRKESFITFDDSRRYSDHEMRAVVLHELGHALGIGGHSDNSRDVMFHEVFKIIEVSQIHWDASVAPGVISPTGGHWGASENSGASSSARLNTKLSFRDVNTLIRLYNCPGPLVELK